MPSADNQPDFGGMAVDFACAGAEIVLAPGTYFETIDLHGKAITLQARPAR